MLSNRYSTYCIVTTTYTCYHTAFKAIILEITEAVEEVQVPVFTKEVTAKIKSLLGAGTFEQQNNKTLKALCKKHGVQKYSKFKKAELVAALKNKGVQPPPRPIGSLSKTEMTAILKLIDVYKILGPAS